VHVGDPIAGARLTVVSGVNADAAVTSDSAGRYMFDNLTGGRFTVAITAPGYVTATPLVELYGDVEVNFALERQ
jgi:hypothetical protein